MERSWDPYYKYLRNLNLIFLRFLYF